MGVISEARERDAQGRPDSSTPDHAEQQDPGADLPDDLPEQIDPFLQQYLTGSYEVDTETVNQMLTGAIAVANLV